MNKKSKNITQLFGKIAFAIFVFIASAILATEILQKKIYFSLFAGIPFGFIMGVIALLIVFKYPSQIWNIIKITFKNLFAFLIGGTLSASFVLVFLIQYLALKTAPGEGFGLVIGVVMMFFFWLIASAFAGGCLGIVIYNLIKHFRKK
jgi:hypothetical protein